MKPDLDIAAEKQQKKKKDVVIYEVNDKGRKYEFGRHSGECYRQSFVSFIESLGFELEEKFKQPHTFMEILIDGVEFYINADSASYMSQNAYTRDIAVRKSVNRFVLIQDYSHSKAYHLKVHINKELDADKLKKKLTAAIEARKKQVSDIELRDAMREKSIMAVGYHYFKDQEFLTSEIEDLNIACNGLTFSLSNGCQVELTPFGGFQKINFKGHTFVSLKETSEFTDNVQNMANTLYVVAQALIKIGPMEKGLMSFVMSMNYHRQFYTKTMSTQKPKKDE